MILGRSTDTLNRREPVCDLFETSEAPGRLGEARLPFFGALDPPGINRLDTVKCGLKQFQVIHHASSGDCEKLYFKPMTSKSQ